MVTSLSFGLALAVIFTVSYIPLILYRLRRPENARVWEQRVRVVKTLLSSFAIIALVGFVIVTAKSTWMFFQHVSPSEFFSGTRWNMGEAKNADVFSEQDAFGAVGLFWGTGYIAIIALMTSWLLGYPAAIYIAGMSERAQYFAVSFCQVLVGVPSIVWGLITILIVAPIVRDLFPSADTENALTAGATMGFMLAPWVTLLVIEGIAQVPQGQWECGKSLGLDKRLTFALIIRPQARAFTWAAVITTASKAVTETMVVLLAAGMRANVSLNPLDAMTTATVQITSLMTGDEEASSPVVLASFALLFVLVAFSLMANLLWVNLQQHKDNDTKAREVVRPYSAPFKYVLSRGLLQHILNGVHALMYNRILPAWADPKRLQVWHVRNQACCSIVLVMPMVLIGAIAHKAWPALWVTEVALQCESKEMRSASKVLAEHLQLVKPSRTVRRDLGKLLSEEEVQCNTTTVASYKLDRWYKRASGWTSPLEVPKLPFANELNATGALSIGFKWAILFSGASSEPERAGTAQALWGTILSIFVISVVVVPAGILVAVYLHFYLRTGRIWWWKRQTSSSLAWGKRVAGVIEVAGNTLLSLPVIAFGMLGQMLLIDALHVPRGSGLVVALTLGMIAFPYVILTSLAAIKSLPDKKGQLDAAQMLGLSYFEAIWKIIIPQAAPSIASGAIFGIIHAVGETAALLPIGSNAFIVDVDLNPMAATTTLSGQIYQWSAEAKPEFENLAALASLELLIICFLLSIAGLWVARLRRGDRKPLKSWYPFRLVASIWTR